MASVSKDLSKGKDSKVEKKKNQKPTPITAKKDTKATTPPAPKKAEAKKPEAKTAQKPAAKKADPKKDQKPKAAAKLAAKPATKAPVLSTVKIDRKVFQEALKVALNFVENKVTIPILSHVRITSTDKTAAIHATELSVFWRRSIPCEAKKPVDICVPAKILYDEVAALQADIATVELVVLADAVTVNGRCRIHTQPAIDFPAFPRFSGTDVDIPELGSKLKKVVVAAADSDSRYTLNTVCVDSEAGFLVATDGHRLHREAFPKADAKAKVPKVLIPKKMAEIAAKLKVAGRLTVGEEYARMPLAGGTMTARLVEGTYPDYDNIVPKKSKMVVKVSSAELLAILDGAVPLSRSSAVSLTINGKLIVKSVNPDAGEYEYSVPCETKKAEGSPRSITFGIDANYLTAALKSFEQETAEIWVDDPLKPTLINGGAVVMPVRI